MRIFSTFFLCVAATAVASPDPATDVEDVGDGIVVALFTDANNRDSRADFTVGKWDFAGFAEWPIHEIKQKGPKGVECRYTGSKSGTYTVRGTGKAKVSPPQHIKNVNCHNL
ncbi:uncharacterized protein B0I36DRAFT_395202 [Microdochium trichocladiopsis]|uniref:Uncharacterized protein n=1 Tax=Microdochium trichocladiopsis TaxID=1682393 RepID=A0A9P8XUM0_9PEZI|nr:uncharacterized protein B0I36DRAFT_395202 [Microdochium trichocladiopsis]KAH7018427.1 hypothetical protein B0I36DRAFT_395202 [Microdochium trichocladiopsis]